MNAKDITTANMKVKVLIYGKSGTGKTSFGCGFPQPYVVDFDNGMLSQRGRDVEFDLYKGKSAYQDFDFKLKELETNCPYETIVLDSITTMQEAKMDMILQMTKKKIPTQYEWMVLLDGMKDLFTRLTKIDKHIVVIGHEMLVQDEITGEIMYMPVTYGKKFPSQLPLFFDEVYRAQVSRDKQGKPVYNMLTAAGSNYMAKSRLGYLETQVELSKDGKMLSGYDVIMSGGKKEE